MTPQELKNSILQLAIQGKLVEQRPEEGTGEELYRQIQAEKQKLIREGRIKKEKPLPEIAEDEVPFEIPESWKWVRLRVVVYSRGQVSPRSKFSYIDIGSIDNKNHRLNPEENIIDANQAPSRARKIVDQGDILYSTVRPYLHNMCIIDRPFAYAPIASTGFATMVCHTGVLNKYILFYFLSPSFDAYANDAGNAKGVAYPAINDDRLYRAPVALPPLSEQKRIVAKIEELLPLIDRYEKAWSRLEEFNRRFPADMQKSLLQMAIQGKLVEQRPEEGTGEELYRQIQAEKQRLIKEGKIKKEKPLPEIAEDEVPFEIPESWKWVRLPAISASCLGKMLDKQKNTGISMPYLRNVNVRWGSFDLSDLLEMKFEDVNDERFLIRKNDLVMCEGGEPGRCAIWTAEQPIHFQKACHRLRFSQELHVPFFYFLFCLYAENGILKSLFTGTTIKHLTGQSLDKIVVPLPPLAKQKRIVAKLEELLPLCERLK
mgnify:CR=1 FL=1